MPVIDTAHAPARVTNQRLAELVQHLSECSHLDALDAVEHAAHNGDDALLVVARALVEVRPRPASGRLRLKPRAD